MLHVHTKGIGVCGMYPYDIAETKVKRVMDDARTQGDASSLHHGTGTIAMKLSEDLQISVSVAHNEAVNRRHEFLHPRASSICSAPRPQDR